MKKHIISIILVGFFATTVAPADQPTHVVLIDDFSGPELETFHGITRATPEDLRDVIKALAGTAFTLTYTAVGEDADHQKPVVLKLPSFAGCPPVPVANPETLDLRTLTDLSERFFREKQTFQKARDEWLAEARDATDAFQRSVLLEQMRTAQVFNKNVVRFGENYRRSDVAGATLLAVRLLPFDPNVRKVLILNTDCADAPFGKPSRTAPFTDKEISPDVILLFVNTSRRPEQGALFSGLKNPVRSAESLPAAAKLMAAPEPATEPSGASPLAIHFHQSKP
ncbi:MAG: hypothetical protein ABL994_06440 [Verrucomicrobiales bacterium]